MADAQEVDKDGTVSKARKFDARDFRYLAEYVNDEYDRRKTERGDRERAWKDIDRQIAMEPEVSFKYIVENGTRKIDAKKAWMAETELPLQAQALEVLTADARRLMFPDTGLFFRAHAETTDEYLKRVEFQSIVMGDETEVPSRITQDNADKLVEGFLSNIYDQTDFETRIDRINAESFKYGMGVGRGRMETKNVYIHEARGVRKDTQRLPVLAPCSIKNLYLDKPISSMHSAQVLGQAHIAVDYMKFENLALAASKGSDDPKNENGGWMPQNIKNIIPDDKGYVTVLEMEGDIVVPRKTVRSIVIPGAIITVVRGKTGGDKDSSAVVRFRFRQSPFSSYLLFPYHYESADDSYPIGPLMKGRPVQMLATDAANRLLDCAMLNILPPVGWDRSDSYFASQGGPAIYPGALWGTTDPNSIKAHAEIGGDPSALASMFTQSLSLYAELTGVLPGRLGAQTNSHTTAFAKDAELQRGAVRTVDYVHSAGKGPMVRWLDMSYRMGRDALKANEKIRFYIDSYGGFVEIDKSHLPDAACFDWLGAGGPQDANQRMQNKVNAALLAVKLDQANLAMGKPSHLNMNSLIDEVMREGGWLDLDAVTEGSSNLAAAQVGPGPAVAAIQNLTQQQPT